MKIRVKDVFLYRDGGVHNSIPPHYSAPPSNRVKPLLEFLDDIAPRITPQEPKVTPQELSPEDDTEAHRIAGELVGIHRDTSDGLTDADAACFAAVLKTFEATYTGRALPSAPKRSPSKHAQASAGYLPGKPSRWNAKSLRGADQPRTREEHMAFLLAAFEPASLIGASNPADVAEFESLYRKPGAKRK